VKNAQLPGSKISTKLKMEQKKEQISLLMWTSCEREREDYRREREEEAIRLRREPRLSK
jgi:hypothetical protein